MLRFAYFTVAAVVGFICYAPARAATVTFFNPSQIATLVTEGREEDLGQEE